MLSSSAILYIEIKRSRKATDLANRLILFVLESSKGICHIFQVILSYRIHRSLEHRRNRWTSNATESERLYESERLPGFSLSQKFASKEFSSSFKGGTIVWREKYLDRSAASTLVTCWNWQGWLILLLAGKTTFFCTGFFFFFPGIERLMFSGQETSLSMCCQRSFAAFGLSKLSPARRVWSDERHIVWKAGPDTCET